MADQTLAALLTVVLFALMAAWVPFLDLLQRIALVAKSRAKSDKTILVDSGAGESGADRTA